MKKMRILLIVFLILILIPLGINFMVLNTSKNAIYRLNDIKKSYDIGLVLGCSVLKDGTPSKMLRDRLNRAIVLYENKSIDKILISGDHQKTYSEVTVMKKYLVENGIPEDEIIVDEIGYSTGESLINVKNNFKDKKIIIITQRYHLYRSLFIAANLGIDAIGVTAKEINYNGQIFREIREILARNKDFVLYKFLK